MKSSPVRAVDCRHGESRRPSASAISSRSGQCPPPKTFTILEPLDCHAARFECTSDVGAPATAAPRFRRSQPDLATAASSTRAENAGQAPGRAVARYARAQRLDWKCCVAPLPIYPTPPAADLRMSIATARNGVSAIPTGFRPLHRRLTVNAAAGGHVDRHSEVQACRFRINVTPTYAWHYLGRRRWRLLVEHIVMLSPTSPPANTAPICGCGCRPETDTLALFSADGLTCRTARLWNRAGVSSESQHVAAYRATSTNVSRVTSRQSAVAEWWRLL